MSASTPETSPVRIQTVHSDSQINAVVQLARTIWSEHYTPIIGHAQVEYMLDRFQSKAAIQQQIQAGYHYSIIYQAERAAGYAAYVRDSDDVLFLSRFYILAARRGLGLGRQFWQRILEDARHLNCNSIRLTVNKNNSRSTQIYTALGFSQTGAVVHDIGSGFVMDDFIMTYSL